MVLVSIASLVVRRGLGLFRVLEGVRIGEEDRGFGLLVKIQEC